MSEKTTPTYGVPGDEDVFAVPGEPAVDQAYLATGSDWAKIIESQRERADEIIVINLGPQHPSTHGVMRLVLEMDGETVMSCRPGIGFLHTGIEKNAEFRTWMHGPTFWTRMNYVANIHNEAVYSMAVDKLLGITDDIPRRATQLRILALETNRIASHLTGVGANCLELGATRRRRSACASGNASWSSPRRSRPADGAYIVRRGCRTTCPTTVSTCWTS